MTSTHHLQAFNAYVRDEGGPQLKMAPSLLFDVVVVLGSTQIFQARRTQEFTLCNISASVASGSVLIKKSLSFRLAHKAEKWRKAAQPV